MKIVSGIVHHGYLNSVAIGCMAIFIFSAPGVSNLGIVNLCTSSKAEYANFYINAYISGLFKIGENSIPRSEAIKPLSKIVTRNQKNLLTKKDLAK